MEQRNSTSESQSGIPSVTTTPPAWIRRTAPYSPDRRAKMLEHMARARSATQTQTAQTQAAKATEPSRTSGWDIVRDAYACAVLSAVFALFFQSRLPFYFGAFIFLTDGERIESALAMIGIKFERGAIGPQIVEDFVSLFGWFALLVSLRGSVPAWLVAWMPRAEPSWSFIAGIALGFAIVEAFAARVMRCALPWFGLEIRTDSLIWKVIKLGLALGTLALLVLHGPV